MNSPQPTADQVRAFRDRMDGTQIYMLNLLKFREKAVYEDGRETDLTGRGAYALYSKGMEKIIPALGGSFIFSGKVRGMLIGEVADPWDAVAIVNYPHNDAMLAMMRDPEYQKIQVHRVAGLEGQLLVECARGAGLGPVVTD